MKKQQHFSAALWLQIKFLYISGKFNSARKLRQHLSKTLKGPIPSELTIRNHITKEHWDKKEIKKSEDDIKARSFSDLFEKLGHGNQQTAELIVNVIKTAEEELKKAKEQLEQAQKWGPPNVALINDAWARLKLAEAENPHNQAKIKVCRDAIELHNKGTPPDPLVISAFSANFDEKFKNFRIVSDFIKEKNKLTGAYAPEKIKVPDGIVLKGAESMSNQELDEQIRDLLKQEDDNK
jgi:hypothetical protein